MATVCKTFKAPQFSTFSRLVKLQSEQRIIRLQQRHGIPAAPEPVHQRKGECQRQGMCYIESLQKAQNATFSVECILFCFTT